MWGGRVDLKKLRDSVAWSRRKLEPYQQNRVKAIREYVGKHYSNDGSMLAVPVNLISLAVDIYTRQLAAKSPKAKVVTSHMQLKPSAALLEMAVNRLVDDIKLGDTITRVVKDEMFGYCVCKLGLNKSDTLEVGGFMHDVGQPFCDHVDIDDWVMDMSARKFEQVSYMGDRYELPTEQAKELYGADISETRYVGHTEHGTERASAIGSGTDTDIDRIRPRTVFQDLWFPEQGLLMTFPLDDSQELLDPVNEIEWDGPEHGPYHFLGYNYVPGNLMPLPPVALMKDMHDLVNMAFRKMGRQAEREKTFLKVSRGDEEDAETVKNASDGEVVALNNVQACEEQHTGGVNPQTFALAIQMKDMFSYMAGNLDSLGGLSPQAETYKQDKLLSDSASERIKEMQDQTEKFAANVMRDLSWYLWQDPLIELPMTRRVNAGGISLEIPVTWTPEQREGDFLDYNVKIEPYSMKHVTPQERLSTVMNTVQTVLLPMAPMLEQQGIVLNIDALLKMIAEYSNVSEIADIIQYMDPERQQQSTGSPVGEPPRKPPFSQREYIRTNRPGGTREGKDRVLSTALMGVGQQPSEMDVIGRPTQ